jgi:hypothetical protein
LWSCLDALQLTSSGPTYLSLVITNIQLLCLCCCAWHTAVLLCKVCGPDSTVVENSGVLGYIAVLLG